MRRPNLIQRPVAALLVLAALAGSGSALGAQDGFLFGPPNGQVTIRGGSTQSLIGGPLYEDITERLTLSREDFRAPAIAAEATLYVGEQFGISLGVGYSESRSGSEYRDWEGDDGFPIEQVTRLRMIPATLGARFYPAAPGRSIGRHAWIPSQFTPYVAGGVGVVNYRLRQTGEFIDHRDNGIFEATFQSDGTGVQVHGGAGADYWFSPRLGVNVEARYAHGSAPTGGHFRGFDDIDLSGVQGSLGLTFRW